MKVLPPEIPSTALRYGAPGYDDPEKLERELRRVGEVCHQCRRCLPLCPSFPRLFELVDATDREIEGVVREINVALRELLLHGRQARAAARRARADALRAHGEDLGELRTGHLEAVGVDVRDVVRGDAQVGRRRIEAAQGDCEWHGAVSC